MLAVKALPACAGTKALMLSTWEEIAGNHEIVATGTALRLFSKKSHTTLIAKAPDWRVHFFNGEKNVMYECSVDEWRNPFGLIVSFTLNSRFSSEPPVFMDSCKIAGIAAKRYQVTAQQEHTVDGRLAGVRKQKADYYVTDSKLNLPIPLCRILQKTFAMPFVDGVPLMLVVRGDWGTKLKTEEAHVASVNPALFELPKNMQKVKSASDVMVGNNPLLNDFTNSIFDARH